jgi:hypothetical protein
MPEWWNAYPESQTQRATIWAADSKNIRAGLPKSIPHQCAQVLDMEH